QYNDTILDGEYIFVANKNKYLFLCFDCLFYKKEDIRDKSLLLERLKYADDVIDKCFTFKNHKGYKFHTYDKPFNINNILKFHKDEIKKYVESLNNDIDNSKTSLIRRKYFIEV